MKKQSLATLILGTVCSLLSVSAMAQSEIIGKVDYDGNIQLTVGENKGKRVLRDLSLPTEQHVFEATELLITTMEDGTYSLTGYIRNPAGFIVKGFRVQCDQDDANNLIVKPGNKRERVTGKPF
jgi:hypothetical protein